MSTEINAIHSHFGLTYAQYLVLPRTALQSMPDEWQSAFVKLLEELNETFEYLPEDTLDPKLGYRVTIDQLVEEFDEDEQRYVSRWLDLDREDPVADYQRGRRRLRLRKLADCQA